MFKFRNLWWMLVVSVAVFVFSYILILVSMNTGHSKSNNLFQNKIHENVYKVFEKRSRYDSGVPVILRSTNVSGVTVNKRFKKDSGVSVTNVDAEMENLNVKRVPANDPHLVQLIRNHFIVPPSEQPYSLVEPDKLDTSMGQAPFVDSRLEYKEGGFFVESGAHDGEYLSNTLFFERTRHWTGILIEPLPEVFKMLQNKHRKAYTLNACLSPYPYPSKEYLSNTPVLGKIIPGRAASFTKTVSVQCLPLYSVLLALNRTTVDFLSLDVEGVEHKVLETIPWDKVDIQMLAVEYDKWPGGDSALCNYMENKGYECSVKLKAKAAADVIFRKKDKIKLLK